MYNKDLDYCLVFYHIPKTAGMTFTDILDRQYGKSHSFHLRGAQKFEDMDAYRALSNKEKMSVNVITGHLSQILKDDIPKQVRLVTFLRDPLSQFTSSYNYIMQTKHNPHNKDVSKLKNLDEYLEWQIKKGHDSYQTRFLGDALPYFKREFGYNPDMQNKKEGDKVYKDALKRLDEIEFVFVTEKFDEAMLVMADALNWKLPLYTRKNTSEHKKLPDEETMKKIKKVHKYDFMVYEAALKRHEEAIEKLGPKFSKKLNAYQKINESNKLRRLMKTVGYGR